MPDRKLTSDELLKFIQEHKTGELFRALEVFMEENTEPSLHDLCISELKATTDALKKILISQGKEIRLLRKKLER